ncbi:FAD-dependent monooxygenase [Amnibacterium sp.]|uniref:NAD(P)/FAD-dependent oxidoreductase n=1 Tax=Amnibacterium sp. TaxID=1872496 RepID=UPI00262C1315|nr:FAD-dependent monooxygenase [Amnibacterium sp.]MCU1475038.1 dependent oxidoreductase [Amnibacterium sp.]
MPDVVVVGGGPVGLATAIAVRLAGLEPVVLEARTGQLDKACGEGLMPGALAVLARLGVDPPGVPLRGFRYADARRSVEHRFPGTAGRGVERIALHAALAARAAQLGVEVRRARVSTLEQDADGVLVAGVRARYAIGADGLHSTVRRTTGLGRPVAGPHRFGLRRHVAVSPWSDLVEVHWGATFELYVTPVRPDLVGVAVLGERGLDLDAALAAVPQLRDRLGGGRGADAVRGAGPLRQRTARRVAGRIALVGDAAGYIDALTGEGLAIGLAGAEQVAAAVAADDLTAYDRGWTRSTRAHRLATHAVLRLATSPARGSVVPLVRTVPALFGAVVDLLARPVPR